MLSSFRNTLGMESLIKNSIKVDVGSLLQYQDVMVALFCLFCQRTQSKPATGKTHTHNLLLNSTKHVGGTLVLRPLIRCVRLSENRSWREQIVRDSEYDHKKCPESAIVLQGFFTINVMCSTMGVTESIAATQSRLNSHCDVRFRSGSQDKKESSTRIESVYLHRG